MSVYRPLDREDIVLAAMATEDHHYTMKTSALVRCIVHAEILIAEDPARCNAPQALPFRQAVDALRAELDYRIPKERP